MFGKPEWFRPKRIGWGLTPISWQGWIYLTTWMAVIVLPFILLMVRSQEVEAVFWGMVCVAALIADVRKILILIKKKEPSHAGPGQDYL